MGACYLNLAGVNIEINTDYDLLITDKFRQFLCTSPKEQADCVIVTECCEKLPEKLQKEYRRELTCFTGDIRKYRNFHYGINEEIPFGVTCMEETGVIRQCYLPAYEKYFQDISAIFKYAGLENFLMSHERILLHASFVKYDNQGILFSAPSGTGKSTQAELWRKTLDAEIINGDRAALSFEDGKWTAWGIPYSGTSGICKNEDAELRTIVILRQGPENKIEKINGVSALKHLYPEISMHPWDRHYVEKAMELLQNLISHVPIYLLECLPDESAVRLLKRTLEEEGI